MANTIANVKNGKYLRKTGDNTYDKIHLETNDGQVVLASDVVISGVTYNAGSPLSDLLANINSTGGKYRLRNYNYRIDGAIPQNQGEPIYLEVSTDGGSTWSTASTVTITTATNALTADSASTATDATYASKIGSSLEILGQDKHIGSSTQPVYVAADGTVTAATAYSSATVNKATNVDLTALGGGSDTITVKAGNGTVASFTVNGVEKATKDASGNVITSTYATKTELANAMTGVTNGYVTSNAKLTGGTFADLSKAKSASQQTVTLIAPPTAVFPVIDGAPSVTVADFQVGDTIYLTDSDKADWFISQIIIQANTNNRSITFYSIEADSPSLSGYVTGSSLTADNIVLGNGSSKVKASTYAVSTNALIASATGSDSYIMTEKATKTTIDTAISSHSGIDKVGTVTSVAVSNGGGLSVSGSPVTSSGTITVSHAVPSGASATTLGSSTSRYYIKTITTDAYGHVTGVTTGNETVTNSNTWRSIKVDGSEKLATGTGTGAVDFVDGTGIDAVWTASGSKISFNLKATGVAAATYSAVDVDSYGRVTAGAQMIMWGNESSFSTDNYDALAENGILITLGA